MNKDIARKIVANLAYRARRARKQAYKTAKLHHEGKLVSEFTVYTVATRANEAWNAYVSSKKILLGLQP